jgi:hypothetical protein
MRKVWTVLPAAVALTLSLSPFPLAAQVGGKEQRVQVQKGTWTGQIVDYACYGKMGAEQSLSADHVKCVIDCMKKGEPGNSIGLLTEGDGMFKITGEMTRNSYARLQEYVGKKVEITGVSSLPIGGWSLRELDAQRIKVVN